MSRTQAIESIAGNPDFRPLATINGIGVELRYASANNFVGRDLYSPIDCAWLHRRAAEGLERSVEWLLAKRADLGLLVLDALRPQRVQEQLWAALQGTELLDYLANPVRGSIHSFGMAVDITLVDFAADARAATPSQAATCTDRFSAGVSQRNHRAAAPKSGQTPAVAMTKS